LTPSVKMFIMEYKTKRGSSRQPTLQRAECKSWKVPQDVIAEVALELQDHC
jgi:hypothetical protein